MIHRPGSPFHASTPLHAPSPLPTKTASARNSSIRVSLASRLGFKSHQEENKEGGEVTTEEKDDVDVESNVPVKESLEIGRAHV